ncbi:MAG: hypothetical protein RIF46_11760, partial [Cyclobacteriaceae bacterium]
FLKKQAICILTYNLKDNVNAYLMKEDSSYEPIVPNGAKPFDVQTKFFELKRDDVLKAYLFPQVTTTPNGELSQA